MKDQASSKDCLQEQRKLASRAVEAQPECKGGSISLLVLIRQWQLPLYYQQQLLSLAQSQSVQEVVLVGKGSCGLPALLAEHPKFRCCYTQGRSFSLMADAGAFEARGEVLLIFEQGITPSLQVLGDIPGAFAGGYQFGGLIQKRNLLWSLCLQLATRYFPGLYWFRLSQVYFVCRKMYHYSGGFKQDGLLVSFQELLSRQQKLSSFTFLFY